MAFLEKEGYAVLEINKLQSRTTGNMIANAPLASDFTGPNGQKYAENGMILAYDPNSTKGDVYEAKNNALHTNNHGAIDKTGEVYGLVYATEHMYDPRNKALNSFCIKPGEYPRLYMLSPSDKFTTNAVEYAAGESLTNWEELKTAVVENHTPVYAVPSNGYLKLQGTKPTNHELIIMIDQLTTTPDGEGKAIKFVVKSTIGA